jgi:peptidoglycan/LPS O-acetylase OafA/YrhL
MLQLRDKIPSLDGLRAVSITLVIISHVFIRTPAGGPIKNAFLALAANGRVGVSVFFVISGFLITTLLIREKTGFNRISLAAFYRRRAFRILPAYFTYLICIGALSLLGIIPSVFHGFWSAVTFTSDYQAHHNWYLDHTWSLSVEEQFYLIWPVIVVFCSRKTLVKLACAVICLDPVLRAITYLRVPSEMMDIKYMGHARADQLMFGCLAALLFQSSRFQRGLETAFRWKLPLMAFVFLFAIEPFLEFFGREAYLLTIGFTAQGCCITLVMLSLIVQHEGRVGAFLNSRAISHLGVLSYSLYLWQQLFIGAAHYPPKRLLWGLLFSFLLAEASFHLVERPFLRLRRRFDTRKPANPESYQNPLVSSEFAN